MMEGSGDSQPSQLSRVNTCSQALQDGDGEVAY